MNQSWNKPKKVLLHGVGVKYIQNFISPLTTIPDAVVTARYKKWRKGKGKETYKDMLQG